MKWLPGNSNPSWRVVPRVYTSAWSCVCRGVLSEMRSLPCLVLLVCFRLLFSYPSFSDGCLVTQLLCSALSIDVLSWCMTPPSGHNCITSLHCKTLRELNTVHVKEALHRFSAAPLQRRTENGDLNQSSKTWLTPRVSYLKPKSPNSFSNCKWFIDKKELITKFKPFK